MLEGELTINAGGRALHAQAGSWVQVPAGVPHSYAGRSAARFLDMHSPSYGLGRLDEKRSSRA